MTPTCEATARISRHAAEAAPLDIDALIRRGRRRRRRGQATMLGGIGALVAGVVGVTAVAGSSAPGRTATVIYPASAPSTTQGLLADHAVAGRVETLTTTASGWRAAAYLDHAGDLCEGWVNPATSVMQGACGARLLHSGPRAASATTLTAPLLIEPEVAVTTRSVDAFGLTGPGTSTVTVTNRGTPLTVVLSTVRSASGQRAFVVRYPFPRVADWVDVATARDAGGTVVGTAQFVAPDTGTPAGPQPTPTP